MSQDGTQVVLLFFHNSSNRYVTKTRSPHVSVRCKIPSPSQPYPQHKLKITVVIKVLILTAKRTKQLEQNYYSYT